MSRNLFLLFFCTSISLASTLAFHFSPSSHLSLSPLICSIFIHFFLSLKSHLVKYQRSPSNPSINNKQTERYIHPPSGRVYNLSFNPPKVPGKDDLTCEPLEQRSDDNPETFKKRLISFRKETEPIRSHYEDLSRESQSGGVKCVTLKGVSSDEIWPGLLKEVKERFER